MSPSAISPYFRLWVGRLLISVVILFNLQCGFLFMVSPQLYSSQFEIGGIPGDIMVRGMGLLFLMWNIPYMFAFRDPIKYRVSLYESIIMQATGLVGEILILLGVPTGHYNLRSTAYRFIIFDGGGLIALITAALITFKYKRGNEGTDYK